VAESFEHGNEYPISAKDALIFNFILCIGERLSVLILKRTIQFKIFCLIRGKLTTNVVVRWPNATKLESSNYTLIRSSVRNMISLPLHEHG
jgi:hypothetical protein